MNDADALMVEPKKTQPNARRNDQMPLLLAPPLPIRVGQFLQRIVEVKLSAMRRAWPAGSHPLVRKEQHGLDGLLGLKSVLRVILRASSRHL